MLVVGLVSPVGPVGLLLKEVAESREVRILPDPVVLVQRLERVARLETAQIEQQQLIRANRNDWILWGALGEDMVYVGRGRVSAGVDLSRLGADDVRVYDERAIEIRLPPVEILAVQLDEDRSEVLNRDLGWLGRPDPSLETNARRHAVAQFRRAALEAGILEEARAGAEDWLGSFFRRAGFEEVRFVPDSVARARQTPHQTREPQ